MIFYTVRRCKGMKRYYVVNDFFGLRVYDSKCKEEFYFDDNEKTKIKKLLRDDYEEIIVPRRQNNSLSAPLKISFNITKNCNLNCKQCFSDSGLVCDDELTTNEVKDLFDDMKEHGTFFICIGGGEPLIRSDILEILEYGKEKGLAVSIVTNGLLLTEELINKLNLVHLDTLWISFEGLKSSHDLLRGEGMFEKAITALELLNKYYDGKVAIRVSVSKNNLAECMDMVAIAEKYNVDLIRFTPLMAYGRAKNLDIVLSQDEYIEFLETVSNIKSKTTIVTPLNIEKNKFWITPSQFGCHCGKEAVWIDEKGRYSPCFFFGEDAFVGNIRTDSYLELWDMSNKLTNFEGNDTCKSCQNYFQCRGGCRARALLVKNSLDAVDPLCPLKNN